MVDTEALTLPFPASGRGWREAPGKGGERVRDR